MASPDLTLVAHGSRSPAAQPVLEGLRAAVQARLPGVTVTLAWIDFGTPRAADLAPEQLRRTVVVPLLLAHGTHLEHDMPAAMAVTPALGPDRGLTPALLDGISGAGVAPGRPLLLAATGSKDPRGRADVETQASWLQDAWGGPVRAGFVTGSPAVEDGVALLTEQTGAVPAVVGYFLAPGRLPTASGAVTPPLAEHPAVADLVVRRYRDASGDAPLGRSEQPPAGRSA